MTVSIFLGFHHEAEVVLLIGRPVALGTSPGWDAIEAVGRAS